MFYEVREDGVYLVCAGVGEIRVPDELVSAWVAERPAFCPDCGDRLARIGDGEPWCPTCSP